MNRFQCSQGKKVHYITGWDCHGLPIGKKENCISIVLLGSQYLSFNRNRCKLISLSINILINPSLENTYIIL
jgi:isoleucyl-tRNA synthetase